VEQESAVGVVTGVLGYWGNGGLGFGLECLQRQESTLKIDQTLSGSQWVQGLLSGDKAAGA
jgi:hypothetical protein